jgi:hypothetical protein
MKGYLTTGDESREPARLYHISRPFGKLAAYGMEGWADSAAGVRRAERALQSQRRRARKSMVVFARITSNRLPPSAWR